MDLETLSNNFPPHAYFELVNAIQQAVNVSAKQFPLRLSMKDSEIKTRVAWCISQAIVLRQIRHWSTERICDTMPVALTTWLRDGRWEPPSNDEHRIWAARE